MRNGFVVVLLCTAHFLSACANVSVTPTSSPASPLTDYDRLYIELSDRSAEFPDFLPNAINLAWTRKLSRAEQVQLARGHLVELLQDLGFSIVPLRDDALAVAILKIGPTRFDPIGGWIAEWAVLTFTAWPSGDPLTEIRAEAFLITTKLQTLILRLAEATGKSK